MGLEKSLNVMMQARHRESRALLKLNKGTCWVAFLFGPPSNPSWFSKGFSKDSNYGLCQLCNHLRSLLTFSRQLGIFYVTHTELDSVSILLSLLWTYQVGLLKQKIYFRDIGSSKPELEVFSVAFLMGSLIPLAKKGLKILGCPISSPSFCSATVKQSVVDIQNYRLLLQYFQALHQRIKLTNYCSNTSASNLLMAMSPSFMEQCTKHLDKTFDNSKLCALNRITKNLSIENTIRLHLHNPACWHQTGWNGLLAPAAYSCRPEGVAPVAYSL